MGREQYYSTTSINILNTLNGCERALLASLVCRDLKVTDSTLVFLTHLLSLSFQWLHLIPNISKGTKGPWKNIKWGKKNPFFSHCFWAERSQKRENWVCWRNSGLAAFPLISGASQNCSMSWVTREKERTLCPTILCWLSWFGWFLTLHGFIIKTDLGNRSLSHCI